MERYTHSWFLTYTRATISLESVARVAGTREATWLLHTHLLAVMSTKDALRNI